MWLMLQQETADDYVLATGETHSVREFVELAFGEVGIALDWTGKGVDEKGINKATGEVIVEVDPRYFRPAEVELLIGDPTKAREELGWEAKVDLDEMVKIMMENDLKEAKNKVFYAQNS
ncbi:MAG: GDP-mannose 4,6-dehydratase, partial [Bacteroidetes bacterium]|nr:GDP-mannose 4,6-dehydratase [Bacteroidota bacterium]